VNSLEEYGVKSAGHACVTGLLGHSNSEPPQVAMKKLLMGHDGCVKYTMPSETWFIQIFRLFGLFIPPKDLKGKKL
jgi:hypothetical protein